MTHQRPAAGASAAWAAAAHGAVEVVVEGLIVGVALAEEALAAPGSFSMRSERKPMG
jgi:hypothetical protein